MIHSPKQIFADNAPAKATLAELADSKSFQDLLHKAFAQYCWSLPSSANPQDSWNSNCRRQGAKDFIETLLTLADPPSTRKPVTAGPLEPTE